MNNKLIISLILPTILLTSCGVPKEAIYVTKNLDNNYVINVDEDDIVNMLSNDMSFALYFYSNNYLINNYPNWFQAGITCSLLV